MTVSLVFNELSLRRPAPDKHTARKWMTEFVGTLKAAIDHKVTVLRMRDNFGDLPLSLDYPMGAWFGDNSVSRDERDFVLAYATQYSFIRPYDEDLRDDENFQSGKLAFEGKLGSDKAQGLGFAYLLKGLALSILSEQCWDTAWLNLDCFEWDPEYQKFVEKSETLRHVARSRHLTDIHVSWIEERIRASVRTGSELLQRASILFPNLVFCKGARKQIEDSAASSMPLPSVLEHLFELEKLANAWEQGEFNYQNIHNASPESPSTLGRFGQQRSFVCPDGQRRLFSWHLKSLPNPWRIHIQADSRQKKILIGYVGRHLPTVRDPT